MSTVPQPNKSFIERIEDFLSAPADLKYEKQQHQYTKTCLAGEYKTIELLSNNLAAKIDEFSELARNHEDLRKKYGALHSLYESMRAELTILKDENHQIVNLDIERLRIEGQERDKDVLKLKQGAATLAEDLAKAQVEIQDKTVTISTLLAEIGNLNRKHDNLLKARVKKGK